MRNSAMQIVTRLLGRLSEEIHRDPFAGCHLGATRRRGTADNQRRRRSMPMQHATAWTLNLDCAKKDWHFACDVAR